MKRLYTIFTNIIWIFVLVFGTFVLLGFLPMTGNMRMLLVQTGSMEPTIHIGSLVLIRPAKNYEVGDIVTKRTDQKNTTVTHRIISKEEANGVNLFITKGDANNVADSGTVAYRDIVGKVFFSAPYLGYLIGFAKTVKGLFAIIIIPGLIVIFDELFKIRKEVSRWRRQKQVSVPVNEYIIDLRS